MSLILNSGLGIGGGSGSDKHNLGWYADPEALSTAHPEGTDGDYAVVGSTDTVWVWDSDSTAWVDTDTKGQVTTVNGQTGDVTVQETLVNQSNIKSINGNSLLGSGNIDTEVIQVNSMPVANADNASHIVQYIGLTDGTYTNGYFYKCISDGQDPATYSWTQIDVQPQGDSLPDQTGQSGKYLTTDGTVASWQANNSSTVIMRTWTD